MTYFIKIEDGQPTGYPILERNFRQLFPNISFPRYFTASDVEPLGYGIYDFCNQPELTRYEKAVEVAPVRSEHGVWCQTWVVVEMDDTEKSEIDERKSQEVRLDRNFRLQNSDWVVVFHTEKGTNIPLEWEMYRQALRDITNHVNFPHLQEADWPVKP